MGTGKATEHCRLCAFGTYHMKGTRNFWSVRDSPCSVKGRLSKRRKQTPRKGSIDDSAGSDCQTKTT